MPRNAWLPASSEPRYASTSTMRAARRGSPGSVAHEQLVEQHAARARASRAGRTSAGASRLNVEPARLVVEAVPRPCAAAPRPTPGRRRPAWCGAATAAPGSSSAQRVGTEVGLGDHQLVERHAPLVRTAAPARRRSACASRNGIAVLAPATRRGRPRPTRGASAAARMRAVHELGGREQPGHRAAARAGSGRARRTAAPCPPGGRGCTRAGGP